MCRGRVGRWPRPYTRGHVKIDPTTFLLVNTLYSKILYKLSIWPWAHPRGVSKILFGNLFLLVKTVYLPVDGDFQVDLASGANHYARHCTEDLFLYTLHLGFSHFVSTLHLSFAILAKHDCLIVLHSSNHCCNCKPTKL